MKNLIILAVSLPLIFFFPLQNIVDRVNHYRMNTTNAIVHKYAEQARITGRFTENQIENMLNELSDYLKIPVNEIEYEVTEIPRYRVISFDEREMIYFDIKIPIDKVVAMHRFFGINDADNSMTYRVKGAVPSELLP